MDHHSLILMYFTLFEATRGALSPMQPDQEPNTNESLIPN